VAILTTDDVDAADIDPNTVTLGDDDGDDTAVATRKNGTLRASLEDVDGDTRDDLVLHFDTQTLIANGDITATSDVLILTGSTSDGTPFGGSDTVRVVPGGPGKAAAGGESTSWGELKRQTR
jgi:hypothetical protein